MGLFDRKEPVQALPDRFVRKCTQSMSMGLSAFDMMVMVDRETGVNYIVSCMYEGGVHITPLLNADGSIVVTDVPKDDE